MRRHAHIEESLPHGAPRWYVGFSTLTTILMTFFITLTVRMGETRDLGYVGPGSGAFREAFNSHGLPGLLRGARRVVDFFSWSDKYLPADAQSDVEGQPVSGRLVDMPERDLKEALTQLARSSDDVILPLPLRYGPRLDDAGRQRLAAAARIIRQTDRNVMVLANLPTGPAATEATLCQATQWALQISRALSEREAIPADRLTAIGRVTPPEAAETVSEPTATLVLRPKAHYAKADVAHDPLHQKPVSQSQIVR